jgi:hypothetical protein
MKFHTLFKEGTAFGVIPVLSLPTTGKKPSSTLSSPGYAYQLCNSPRVANTIVSGYNVKRTVSSEGLGKGLEICVESEKINHHINSFVQTTKCNQFCFVFYFKIFLNF